MQTLTLTQTQALRVNRPLIVWVVFDLFGMLFNIDHSYQLDPISIFTDECFFKPRRVFLG